MKKFLLLAAVAATMLNVNAQYKVEKLWGTEDVPASADCRQGIGLNGKFYINHKGIAANEETGQEAVEPYVMVYGEGGLANEQFPGGPNCGISIDQAGHIIVSLATFPSAASWIFDDETAMIRVIDPETAEVTDLPLGGGALVGDRMDVLGRAFGDLLDEGELYLPKRPADGTLCRYFYEGGEVLGEDCYCPLLSPAPGADNMTIINAVVDADGNDAIFYYQRGGMPYLYYWDGDNLEGEAINIPAAENGMIRCNQNGADFFAFNGKNFVVYPLGEANNSYFDGFAIYEIGAEAPFFVKEPTIAAAANAFQANWLNAEVTEDGVLIYQYAPGKSIEVYKLSLEAEETNVYILGSVNGNGWDPSVGVQMEYADGEYSADINIADEFGYFSFTKKLAENSSDWDAIAPYRFTVVSTGDFEMTDDLYGQPLQLDEDGMNYNNAIKVPAGDYKLVINLDDRTLVITKEEEIIEPVEIEEFYVVGTFNGWDQNEGRIEFTENEAGELEAEAILSQGDEFKLIAPTETDTKWFGGADDNGVGYFLINEDLLGQPIDLVSPGANFHIDLDGTYCLKIAQKRGLTEPLVLTVTNISPSAITDITASSKDNTWYNIQGMKINGVPTVPGIYVNGGKKVVIK